MSRIMIKIAIVACGAFWFAVNVQSVQGQSRIVGYYAYWLRQSLPADRVQYDNLSHINHAFVWPNADGSLVVPDGIPDTDLVDAAHRKNVKVLISVGGAGQDAGFTAMAADSSTRLRFVREVVDFVDANEYDGVDLDWEFPGQRDGHGSSADTENFSHLVQELRESLNDLGQGMLLTMAAPPGAWFGDAYDFSTFIDRMDWISCMAYNFHGNWTNHAGHNAPLFAPRDQAHGSAELAINYFLNVRSIPKEKLLLGVPFYGRPFNASGLYRPSTGGGQEVHFAEIAPLSGHGWTYHWDPESLVPYLLKDDGTEFITFDDSAGVVAKSDYAVSRGLGGVMIWALGQDLVAGQQSLLHAIGEALRNPTRVDLPKVERLPEFELLGNYPNPFNPATTIVFRLHKPTRVEISIWNIAGRRVAGLLNEEVQPGLNSVRWEAEHLASGVYFARMRAGQILASRKLLLVK